MKAILISIRPEWVVKILNGEKTIEIRKKFPKDYVGWVYIYCTKNGTDCYGMPTDLVDYRGCAIYNKFKLMPKGEKVTTDDNQPRLNGKVVARFWCDKMERINRFLEPEQWYMTYDLSGRDLLQKSCLSFKELDDYLLGGEGYAVYVAKLEIFDKPKELYDLKTPKPFVYTNGTKGTIYYPLTYAPQNWQYIEVQE